ncbi:MAG: hypothetical protein AB1Z55_09705, partial [Acidimicrobiia bacterium]
MDISSHSRRRRSTVRLLGIVLAISMTACTGLVTEPLPETEPSPSVATTTTSAAAACLTGGPGTAPVATGGRALDAITLSGEVFACAPDVVVVGEASLSEAVAAAQLAAALVAPLLLPHPQLAAELGRLDPERVHVVGAAVVEPPPGAELVSHDIPSAIQEASERLAAPVVEPTDQFSKVVDAVLAMESEAAVVSPDVANAPVNDVDRLVTGLARPTDGGPVWIVDAADPFTVLLAAAYATSANASVIPVDADDLFRHPEVGEALAGYPDRPLRTVGLTEAPNDWKLRTLARGEQLPGGGFELFPDHINRRLVGFYGNPASPALGAMGMVAPEEALDLMRDGGVLTGYLESGCFPSPCQGTVQPGLLDGFAADGATVVPLFNYIGSVAQPRCGTALFPIERFQDGIDVAGREGGYVVFDLQPGSQDFLTQVRAYEPALRLPHVSVGLDPEWRCAPGQTDFDRIGTVTAAEVNQVIDWLADLVNAEALPQKLLVIQQFRFSMIQDRDQITERPEVQVLIQMDGEGQGNLSTKDGTWEALIEGTED